MEFGMLIHQEPERVKLGVLKKTLKILLKIKHFKHLQSFKYLFTNK